MEQNYPNPFNPTTNIEFTVPAVEQGIDAGIANFGSKQGGTSFVSLKIFDILGNEVTTLVNEEKPAGNYRVTFNAAELPSGVYFYRLQSRNLSDTKKLILMR